MQGKLTDIEIKVSSREENAVLRLTPTYSFKLDGQWAELSPHQPVSLTFNLIGGALCKHCQAPLRKKFPGGYCYQCFTTLARCDLCVMSPDRCHLHLGTCREPEWGEQYCQQPHWVYLSLSSGPKVGITRGNRLHRRWVDQGASQALAIANVPTRRAAGAVELELKKHVSDRTDWRRLVSGNQRSADLWELSRQLRQIVPDLSVLAGDGLSDEERASMRWLEQCQLVTVDYPVMAYAPANMLKLNPTQTNLHDNLLGFIGNYILLRQGVLAFSELVGGDVVVSVGETLPAQVGSPQLNLF